MVNYGLSVWIAGVAYAVFYLLPPIEGLGYLGRIVFFHIPVAWVSVVAFFVAAINAWRYLRTRDIEYDRWSSSAVSLGMIFCLMATASGAIFAKLTWGAYWNWDPRQTTIFILLLIYGAYLALRASLAEQDERARICAVYALLSSISVPFLVFIIPRYYFSLHPEPLLNSAGRLEMEPIMIYVLMAAVGGCTVLFWQLLIRSVHNKKADKRIC
jgi:heme exporter protein C